MLEKLKADMAQIAYKDNGRYSHSKLWSNIGKFILVAVFLVYCYRVIYCSTDMNFSSEFLLIFILAIIFPELLSKFIERKYGCKLNDDSNKNESSVENNSDKDTTERR